MAKHNEILKTFKSIIPMFDFGMKDHKDLVSIKYIMWKAHSLQSSHQHIIESLSQEKSFKL